MADKPTNEQARAAREWYIEQLKQNSNKFTTSEIQELVNASEHEIEQIAAYAEAARLEERKRLRDLFIVESLAWLGTKYEQWSTGLQRAVTMLDLDTTAIERGEEGSAPGPKGVPLQPLTGECAAAIRRAKARGCGEILGSSGYIQVVCGAGALCDKCREKAQGEKK